MATEPLLVDTSTWIDFFSLRPGAAGVRLRALIEAGEPPATTGIIFTEVLQGLTRDRDAIERLLLHCAWLEPRAPETYRSAARLYQRARAGGVTLTTVDALIAAVAIENRAVLFTLDQDFTRLANLVPLRLLDFRA